MKETAIFLYRHNRSNFYGELTWTKGKKREVSEKKVYDLKLDNWNSCLGFEGKKNFVIRIFLSNI